MKSQREIMVRLRYEMRKSGRLLNPYPPIIIEPDENNPNRLNVIYEPKVLKGLRMFVQLTRQRIAVTTKKRRKRSG
jgi:hypothetical protein